MIEIDIDILRNNLRELQILIYSNDDSKILTYYFDLKTNINLLKLKNTEINDILINMKKIIFTENINKTDLFKNTVKLDNYLEQHSIDYHKK